MSWYDLLWWESRHIRCLLLTYKESFFNLFNKTTVNFPSRLCWEIEQKFADIIFLLFTMHLCPILCKPMYCSMPGFLVLHHLPELAQTHVHWVGDTIQPSHPLSSPSPPAFNLSQHQGLFQWVSSLHQVAKVLEFQLQHQSFKWADTNTICHLFAAWY